jgi:hypothetical protein
MIYTVSKMLYNYQLGKYQAPPIPEGIPQDAHDFLSKCFIM